jgi:hypothetical protein
VVSEERNDAVAAKPGSAMASKARINNIADDIADLERGAPKFTGELCDMISGPLTIQWKIADGAKAPMDKKF